MDKRLILTTLLLLGLFGCTGSNETTMFSETAAIAQDETQFWFGDLNSGETLVIDLQVVNGGPVDVLILDSEGYGAYNYNLGGGTEDVTAIEYALGVKEYKKEIPAEKTGTYYIVVDNTEFPEDGTTPIGSVSVKADIKVRN